MLHCCVGYYPNGSMVVNTVCDEHLQSNIEYNKKWRPGRFYFVDGKYACGGICSNEKKLEVITEVEKLLEEKDIKADLRDSAPYL